MQDRRNLLKMFFFGRAVVEVFAVSVLTSDQPIAHCFTLLPLVSDVVGRRARLQSAEKKSHKPVVFAWYAYEYLPTSRHKRTSEIEL